MYNHKLKKANNEAEILQKGRHGAESGEHRAEGRGRRAEGKKT